ncbi:hypothetical protein Godav_027651 [Gossypium davidsonii]|uniref:Uncharacterized protein n=2 Tax=Gossypium TaxID=3633 RepID=A0A7J8RWQ8_GOSDV|nr:hypothetical protein [Gossypium davidsonii]MBA0653641.1 hypothetical protein [Gossypium klotzschianum]
MSDSKTIFSFCSSQWRSTAMEKRETIYHWCCSFERSRL